MSINEIEAAITQLQPSDVAKLADWFAEYQAELWDRQIERDSNAGKLDDLLKQANAEFDAGRCKPL